MIPDQAGKGEGLETPYSVRAVVRVLDILDLLQNSTRGVSLSEVAAAARLPKSSAYRYLVTLESRSYVERDPVSGLYRFGQAFLPSHTRHLQILAARARPVLEQLRDRFQETANLGVLDGNRVSYLEILESPWSMRLASRVGDRDPIHSAALGKAIASTLEDEAVHTILAVEGMAQLTPRTITSPERFFAELGEVRRMGYAIDNGENEEGGRCVAVPIAGGRVPAAISLSAPAMRCKEGWIEDVANALLEAVSRFFRPPEVRRG